jgi:broad specificity phosphatase PhoE
MPVDLVFIRHGRSEGNEAREQSKQGDNSAYTERFRARLNRELRLTDLGIAQAQAAGEFIRKQISPTFSRYYTSGTCERGKRPRTCVCRKRAGCRTSCFVSGHGAARIS